MFRHIRVRRCREQREGGGTVQKRARVTGGPSRGVNRLWGLGCMVGVRNGDVYGGEWQLGRQGTHKGSQTARACVYNYRVEGPSVRGSRLYDRNELLQA